jgi:hypothetical protein
LIGLAGLLACSKKTGVGDGEKPSTATVSTQIPAVKTPESEPVLAPAESDELSAGTLIDIQLEDVVDSDTTPVNSFVPALVTRDVAGRTGKRAIPAGSPAVLIVRKALKESGESMLTLSLFQVSVEGKSYVFMQGSRDTASLEFVDHASKGSGHRSVHMEKRSVLQFKVTVAMAFHK